MSEWFVVANSFAAPFFSDTSEDYVEGETARDALKLFMEGYKHPFGLFAAVVYESADDYHKGRAPAARWTSNKAVAVEKIVKERGAVLFDESGPDGFIADGVRYDIPKGGKFT